MATKKSDQDDQQDKLSFDISGDISDIQSAKKKGTRWSRSQIIGILGGSVLIISIIAVTLYATY